MRPRAARTSSTPRRVELVGLPRRRPSVPWRRGSPPSLAHSASSRSGGVEGAASSTVSMPSAAGGRPPPVELLEREVGEDRAGHPCGGQLAGGPGVAVGERDVGVRHGDERDAERAPGELARRPSSPSWPASSARAAAAWITGPSMTGSEKGRPDLERVDARGDEGLGGVEPAGRAAGHDVGDEAACGPSSRCAPSVAPSAQAHRSAASRAATWAMSLSPRPDSPTSTVAPARDRATSLAEDPGDAWADSSAAMIPSVRASRCSASSTSSSLAEGYSARPVAAR